MSAAMSISRRHFLRSAGGVTFLALSLPGADCSPRRGGGRRATAALYALPVHPAGSEQPASGGPGVDGRRVADVRRRRRVLVEFGATTAYGTAAVVTHSTRDAGRGGDAEQRYNWTADAAGLSLGAQVLLPRPRQRTQTLAEGYFTTRQPRGHRIRFVAFGDNSYGDISDRAIAYHTYKQHPDFVMNCGDNVYESGTDDEYQRYFFPVYNADLAGPREGAPLLRSVPFYTVIANHDVQGKDEKGHEVADFARNPDALAFYTAMHLPLNGPDGACATRRRRWDRRRRSTRSAPAPATASRAWRTTRSTTATRTFSASTRTATSIPTTRRSRRWIAADLSAHRRDLEVRRLPPSAVQRRRRTLRSAAHARARTAVRGARRRHRAERTRAQLPAGAAVEVRCRHDRDSPPTSAGRIAASPAPSPSTARSTALRNTRPDGVLYIVTGAGGKHLYDAGFTDDPAAGRTPTTATPSTS